MDKITLNSPAKINIGLRIIGKREDGYHNIQTIFYPLLLADVLSFEKNDKTILETNSDELKQTKGNLIIKAKDILENYAREKMNVRINLKKNIPLGAGLGGGSSNAAVTLKSLNTLYNLNFNYEILSKLALIIGSDVPFFLDPVASFATSRGEQIKNIPLSLSNPILLVNPGINISTKWAFDQVKVSRDTNAFERLSNLEVVKIEDIKQSATNDFEDIVFNTYPEIRIIKEELYTYGATFVLMTGTGSTLYGIFSNLQKAKLAQDHYQNRYFTFINYPVNKGSIT